MPLLERVPFEAQNALRGEAGAFDSLAGSLTQATALRAPGGAEADASWHRISDAVATVGAARSAVATVQAVNQEVHDLSPKLLSALGDFASAADLPKSDAMTRYSCCFELTAQRMQQDLNGLAGGVSDVAPTAQRLADGTAYLSQVVRGLSGEESAMALPRITGADGEAALKALVQRHSKAPRIRCAGDGGRIGACADGGAGPARGHERNARRDRRRTGGRKWRGR